MPENVLFARRHVAKSGYAIPTNSRSHRGAVSSRSTSCSESSKGSGAMPRAIITTIIKP
jgi:hypothetical protein